VDRKKYHEATPASLKGKPWVFDSPHFLIMNLAVGGNWPGQPDRSTRFPQRLTVDYVRVYTR
jgi:beta-glucanase (GH16 family)